MFIPSHLREQVAFFTMREFLSKISIFSILLFLGSCDPGTPDEKIYYDDFFENVADGMIIPRYANFQQQLIDLSDILALFDSSNSQSLIEIQNQFKSTYISWQYISAFEFGPSQEYFGKLQEMCNTFPTQVSDIESNILSGDYNLDFPTNYDAKGLPAIDYLLFHTSTSGLLEELSNFKRIQYINDCIIDMQTRVSAVLSAWDQYRDVFVQSQGNDVSSSLSILFNQYLFDYERLKRDKFAVPAGFATQYGIPILSDTSVVEAKYSKMSIALLQANLISLERIYMGVNEQGIDGVGFYEKLLEYNAQSTVVDGDLALAIQEQFSICKNALTNHVTDLPNEIINHPSEVELTSSELQKMVPMLKNDMRSYLSVSVTEGDPDGD
ncbi:MAG: hypothetical protein CMP57_03045 [Flavobacteriales bacterium]|nr:hypothetical protein [Flavobacteriales bacterium]